MAADGPAKRIERCAMACQNYRMDVTVRLVHLSLLLVLHLVM
jgi:hypothetical protein